MGAYRPDSGEPTPVLWLHGPRAVGKSTVGWEIYSQLLDAGVPAGYVDIDQLGICYPAPADDPDRHRMKARNLDAVVATFRAAGAGCVVVSGVADPDLGVRLDELPRAEVTVCRLRADHEELTRRYLDRGTDLDCLEHTLREAAHLDGGGFTEVCVDTSGLPVAEVARRVRDRTGGWLARVPGPVCAGTGAGPTAGGPTAGGPTAGGPDPAGPVLWLYGATGVGTSTVGFDVYLRAGRAGLTAAYVDLDQIGFCGPAPADHRVRAANLAALWRTYHAAGASCMVVVGPVGHPPAVEVYRAALPSATYVLCRLHAGPDQLTRRIMRRGAGFGWPQPGDPLVGRPLPELLRIAERAARDAAALELSGVGHRIDTDGSTAEEVAEEVAARTGWPPTRG